METWYLWSEQVRWNTIGRRSACPGSIAGFATNSGLTLGQALPFSGLQFPSLDLQVFFSSADAMQGRQSQLGSFL